MSYTFRSAILFKELLMIKTEKINLRLTPQFRQKLDIATKTKGVNMSRFVRSALERELAEDAL